MVKRYIINDMRTPSHYILAKVNLVDTQGGIILEERYVEVEDGVIKGVTEWLDNPSNALVIDLTGYYLCPALINLGVNGFGDGIPSKTENTLNLKEKIKNFRNALLSGVTTVVLPDNHSDDLKTIVSESKETKNRLPHIVLSDEDFSSYSLTENFAKSALPREYTSLNEGAVNEATLELQKRIESIKNDPNIPLSNNSGRVFCSPAGLWRELCYVHEQCGISNADVLKLATIGNAEKADISTEVGTIEANKRADMLILYKNPFDTLFALRDPRSVILSGDIISSPPPTRESKLERYLDLLINQKEEDDVLHLSPEEEAIMQLKDKKVHIILTVGLIGFGIINIITIVLGFLILFGKI